MLGVAALVLRDEEQPLLYSQLTHLQLVGSDRLPHDFLDTAPELPRLEIFEALDTYKIGKALADQLPRMPSLRVVNLSKSLLCETHLDMEPAGKPPWVPICECMPEWIVEDLTCLQAAAPHISCTMDYMGCSEYDW